MMRFLRNVVWLASLLLAGCNGSSNPPVSAQARQASMVAQQAGVTPFIATLTLQVERYGELASAGFTIAPKPGTYSRPVSVDYEKSWFERTRAFNAASGQLAITVFGLYANYRNDITVTLRFNDGASQVLQLALQTAQYAGPASVYQAPAIRRARGSGNDPGFDYVFIKNRIATPVVIDTDGNLRWVGNSLPESLSSLFAGDSFYVGSATAPTLHRVFFDGTTTSLPIISGKYANFHHDLTQGKVGLLAEFDTVVNNFPNGGTIIAEIANDGAVLKEWDLATIFSTYMRAHGDDPFNFVRAGADWLHINSAIYDPRDDTLIVSSRENFIVKIGYDTGDIRWIFGDTSKHWYVDYPSLRALALRLTSGKAPIGEHALSLLANGDLLLLNNGLGSLNNPPGTSPGITREFSTPSRYAIDETTRTAREAWSYNHVPTTYSDVCSSVYEATPGKYLVGYAAAQARTSAILLGVDSQGNVSFEFDYPTSMCGTLFIAQPIAFEALRLR